MYEVYLTGSSGFLGRHVHRALAQDSERRIHTVGRSGRDYSYATFEAAPTTRGALIHLAGVAHDLRGTATDDVYRDVNVDLTRRVFDRFLDSNLELMIFVSSVKAIADRSVYPLTEAVTPRPMTSYGKSKLAAEQLLLTRGELPKGKRLVILRPSMIHGPGNKGNLNLLARVVARGIPYPLAAFENRRHFTSVSNACFAIDQILLRRDVRGVFNLADDDYLSTNEVVRILAEEMGRPERLWRIPRRMLVTAAFFGDLARLPLNSSSLSKLTDDFLVDNSALKSALAVDRLPMTARDGIRATARSLFAEQSL